MTLTPQMHMTLVGLNMALINQDEDKLLECLGKVELNELLSEATIREVRARGKKALTLFLCTLAVSNEVDAESAQFWLDCHHSITNRHLHAGIQRMPVTNIVRRLVEAAVKGSALHKAQVKSCTGSSIDWHHAFELALDLRDWDTAYLLVETLKAKRIDSLVLMKIARTLTERHTLYVNKAEKPEVDVDYDRLAGLYELFVRVAHQSRHQDLAGSLSYLPATCLETGGRHDDAVTILRSLEASRSKGMHKVSIARALCKGGRMQEAVLGLVAIILKFNMRLAKTEHEGVQTAVEGTQGTTAAKQKYGPSFDVGRASEALRTLAQVFKDNGQKFFLVSGTLLGYEREGQLLAHDKDIDVGVIGWENQYDICMALQKSGEFTFSVQLLKGDRAYYFPIMHNSTATWIDIFVYYPQDDKLVTGVDFFFGHQQRFAFTPFNLKPVNFLGVDMYVPDDIPRNLEENFGDWRVPDPSYISHMESPSTVDKGNPGFMMTARLTALTSLITQKTKKLRKVIDIMRDYVDHPMGMSGAVLERLSVLCDEMEQAEKDKAEQAARETTEQAVKEEAYA